MESVSDEDGSDHQSERCGSYSLSADVSESESSADFSGRRFASDPGPSGSLPSSPVCATGGRANPPAFAKSAAEGRLLVWEGQSEKREVDLSGALHCSLAFVSNLKLGAVHLAPCPLNRKS